jgi:molybdopterin synthase sulfur carrier subunit
MPRIRFTPHLQRHIDSPPREVSGATVGKVLDAVFADNPRLRSYLLDDQGHLREHVSIFIDDEAVADRETLDDSVPEDAEIFVLQALSGG